MHTSNEFWRELSARSIPLTQLADQLKINRQAVWKWRQRGVPAGRLIEIEQFTGIPREVIIPELFVGMTRA